MEGTNKAHENGEAMGFVGVRLTAQLGDKLFGIAAQNDFLQFRSHVFALIAEVSLSMMIRAKGNDVDDGVSPSFTQRLDVVCLEINSTIRCFEARCLAIFTLAARPLQCSHANCWAANKCGADYDALFRRFLREQGALELISKLI